MYQDLKNFNALVTKAQTLAKQKQDFLVPAQSLTLMSDQNHSYLNVNGKGYSMQDRAQRQLAEICSIPYNYYQMLRQDYPDLLDNSVNTLITDCTKNKLVRTLGGSCRAILSDRFSRVEHEDVLSVVSPLIEETKMTVASCSITPEKMYIKLISKTATADVKVGDAISFGAIVQNSEVGMSAIHVVPFCMRLVCTNGMQLPQYLEGTRKIHLGKQLTDVNEYETPDFDTIYSHIKESLMQAIDPQNYLKVINAIRCATEIKVSNPMETIERVAKNYSLSAPEKSQVLFHLLNDKDLSLFGLGNAITRTAQDATDYTRATTLEEVGSRVLYDGLNSIKKNNPDMLLLAA